MVLFSWYRREVDQADPAWVDASADFTGGLWQHDKTLLNILTELSVRILIEELTLTDPQPPEACRLPDPGTRDGNDPDRTLTQAEAGKDAYSSLWLRPSSPLIHNRRQCLPPPPDASTPSRPSLAKYFLYASTALSVSTQFLRIQTYIQCRHGGSVCARKFLPDFFKTSNRLPCFLLPIGRCRHPRSCLWAPELNSVG